jgi:threonine aldolase
VVPPDTNIVMVDLPARIDAMTVVARAREAGVLVTAWSATRVRCVLHLDVDDAALAAAVAALQGVLR